MLIRERLAAELAAAAARVREARGIEGEPGPVSLDVPPTPDLGDFSSDIALTLARAAGASAPELAAELARNIPSPSGLLERVEVSSSGFLNFHLRPDWLQTALAEILEQGDGFGRSPDLGRGEKVLVEFVSAYPTGPLTVTHGRGAALGDALASVLEWSGYEVARESYVNDAGRHMDRFGRTLEALYLRACGRPADLPLDGYTGEYVEELAGVLHTRLGSSLVDLSTEARRDRLEREGVAEVLNRQQAVLARMGVRLDGCYSERSLHESGKVSAVVETLRARGDAYDQDGAVWLRSTAHGEREDRALIRSSGRPSYLAGDLAYHWEKRARGFTRMIDVWNAEHQGYVQRTRAGIAALGIPQSTLEILIFQPVALKLQGSIVEGASAGGNTILLQDVIEEVGAAAARFFYLRKPAGTMLELDLDLARSPEASNPFVAVRQALSAAAERAGEGDVAAPRSPACAELMQRLASLPDEIRAAAREREPARLSRYLTDVAAAFERVRAENLADPVLSRATGIVLRNALRVIGAVE